VEQRLRLAQARADEAKDARLFVDALAPTCPLRFTCGRWDSESAAAVVLTRTLVALGEGVMPEREALDTSPKRVAPRELAADLPARPRLRLDDAAAARRRLA
jgi:hypothetical protein